MYSVFSVVDRDSYRRSCSSYKSILQITRGGNHKQWVASSGLSRTRQNKQRYSVNTCVDDGFPVNSFILQ